MLIRISIVLLDAKSPMIRHTHCIKRGRCPFAPLIERKLFFLFGAVLLAVAVAYYVVARQRQTADAQRRKMMYTMAAVGTGLFLLRRHARQHHTPPRHSGCIMPCSG